MKYKALFLDLDGTILDTLKDIQVAVNYSLKLHGFKERSLEEIRLALGYGSPYLIKTSIGKPVDETTFQAVYNDYIIYYHNHVDVYTKRYPNILQILTKFKQNGGKIALITNKPHDIAVKLMGIYFPNIFDIMFGKRDDIKSKPDPESLNLAMSKLNLKREDVLYVGDSLVDVETAKNSNLDYVICTYGFQTKDVLLLNGVSPLIDNATQLEGYLY